MNDKINKLREEIDKLDEFLVYLLFKRLELVEKIGELKKKYNIPLYVPEREKEIIKKCIEFSKNFNLSNKFIELIFKTVFNESKLIEQNVLLKNIN